LDQNLKTNQDEFLDLKSLLDKNSVDSCVENLPVENCIMWSRINSFNNTNDDEESNTGIISLKKNVQNPHQNDFIVPIWDTLDDKAHNNKTLN
jgi:hypothetical protein